MISIRVYSVWAVLGLCGCVGFSCGDEQASVASLVAEHGPWSAGSAPMVHGLSFSAACGTFPDSGSNSCPLCLQANSLPLSPSEALKNI